MNDESLQRREYDERAGRSGLSSCPDCGHDTVGDATWPERLVAIARAEHVRPSCPELMSSVEAQVGLPGPCGCRDPWHR